MPLTSAYASDDKTCHWRSSIGSIDVNPEDSAVPPVGGVTVAAWSQLRIPAGGLTIDLESGEIGPVLVELRTDLWPYWLEAARAARSMAMKEREGNPGPSGSDGNAFGSALQRELTSGMTAICGCAFAFEGFRNSVVHQVPSAIAPAKSTAGRVHQTLLRAFDLTDEQSAELRRALRVLFRLRNDAVHPSSAFAPPLGHPVFGTGMDRRFVEFSAQQADQIVQFTEGALGFLLHRPRARHVDLIAWCATMREATGLTPRVRVD